MGIIQRFAATRLGKPAEHFHHPIQVSDLLFDFFNLAVASLGEPGASRRRAKCEIQKVLSIFEGESEFLNPLHKLDRPYIGIRVFPKTGCPWRLLEKALPLVEADGLDAYSGGLRQASNRHFLNVRLFHA